MHNIYEFQDPTFQHYLCFIHYNEFRECILGMLWISLDMNHRIRNNILWKWISDQARMTKNPKPSFSIIGSLELYIAHCLIGLKLGFKSSTSHISKLPRDAVDRHQDCRNQ